MSSSRSPPAEITARRPGVCHLDGKMVHFAGCACLLVRCVVWSPSDKNSVQNRKSVRSVQFACLIGSADRAIRFGTRGPSKYIRSVRAVQFTNSSGPIGKVIDGGS